MRLKGESKRILLGWVLIVQVLFHLCSSTLFIHSHIIDGHEIVHSHFFAGPVSEHSHTTESAESIKNATYGAALTAATTSIDAPLSIASEIHTHMAEVLATADILYQPLRAPPAVA